MHQILPADGNLVWVKVGGKLTREDYDRLVPAWEGLIARHGRIRLLFEMLPDFSGWEAGAAWQDLKFSVAHRKDMDRVAMVGDRKWEEWTSRVAALLVNAEVRFFDTADLASARSWLEE